MLTRMPPSQAATLRRKGRKTGTGVMLKAVYAIAAAAIVAASFVGTLSLSPRVEARGSTPKADRADTRLLAKDCSKQAWPYFEAACLRDTRHPYGQAREVRLVSADRWRRQIPSANPFPAPAMVPGG